MSLSEAVVVFGNQVPVSSPRMAIDWGGLPWTALLPPKGRMATPVVPCSTSLNSTNCSSSPFPPLLTCSLQEVRNSECGVHRPTGTSVRPTASREGQAGAQPDADRQEGRNNVYQVHKELIPLHGPLQIRVWSRGSGLKLLLF